MSEITLTDICKAPLEALSTAIREHDADWLADFRSNMGSLQTGQMLDYTEVSYRNQYDVVQRVKMPTILLESNQFLGIDQARLDFKVHFSSLQKQDDGKLRILSSIEDGGQQSMNGHMHFDLKFVSRSLVGTQLLIDHTRNMFDQTVREKNSQALKETSEETKRLLAFEDAITKIMDAISQTQPQTTDNKETTKGMVDKLLNSILEFKDTYGEGLPVLYQPLVDPEIEKMRTSIIRTIFSQLGWKEISSDDIPETGDIIIVDTNTLKSFDSRGAIDSNNIPTNNLWVWSSGSSSDSSSSMEFSTDNGSNEWISDTVE